MPWPVCWPTVGSGAIWRVTDPGPAQRGRLASARRLHHLRHGSRKSGDRMTGAMRKTVVLALLAILGPGCVTQSLYKVLQAAELPCRAHACVRLEHARREPRARGPREHPP